MDGPPHLHHQAAGGCAKRCGASPERGLGAASAAPPRLCGLQWPPLPSLHLQLAAETFVVSGMEKLEGVGVGSLPAKTAERLPSQRRSEQRAADQHRQALDAALPHFPPLLPVSLGLCCLCWGVWSSLVCLPTGDVGGGVGAIGGSTEAARDPQKPRLGPQRLYRLEDCASMHGSSAYPRLVSKAIRGHFNPLSLCLAALVINWNPIQNLQCTRSAGEGEAGERGQTVLRAPHSFARGRCRFAGAQRLPALAPDASLTRLPVSPASPCSHADCIIHSRPGANSCGHAAARLPAAAAAAPRAAGASAAQPPLHLR